MRENLPHFSGCHTRNTIKPTEHRAPGLLAFNHNRHAGPQVCDGLNRAGPHFKSADIVAGRLSRRAPHGVFASGIDPVDLKGDGLFKSRQVSV